MTPEYLLDAMGLIDDELIYDADKARPAPKTVPWRRWGAWAACLALVLALGYGVTRLGMGGASGGSATSAGSSASIGGSAAPSGTASDETAGGGAGDSSAGASVGSTGENRGSIYLECQGGSAVYALTGGMVDDLPGDSRLLGVLSALYPDAPCPTTSVEAYEGCPVFEGPEGMLYVQLPDGGFAVAELVQP